MRKYNSRELEIYKERGTQILLCAIYQVRARGRTTKVGGYFGIDPHLWLSFPEIRSSGARNFTRSYSRIFSPNYYVQNIQNRPSEVFRDLKGKS